MGRPWQRTAKDFKHADLRAWTREHREDLVLAVMTLLRGWIVAGKPMGNETLGMFETRAGVMGGILKHARVPGFLTNLGRMYDAVDDESAP